MSPFFESSKQVATIIEAEGLRTPISKIAAAQLQELAQGDAKKLLLFSLLTISDAIVGIGKRRYSWAIIKLYYSSFYSVRSILCDNGYVIAYIDGRPFEISV
jgi:hypothetical protein